MQSQFKFYQLLEKDFVTNLLFSNVSKAITVKTPSIEPFITFTLSRLESKINDNLIKL